MRIERVPFAALGAHVPPIALGYLTSRLGSRFPVDSRDPSRWRGRPARIPEAVEGRLRGLGAPPESLAALERLRKGAPAVVTGQQPAVAGGPMYDVYKAITAIRLARAIGGVAVFWNHSDDHHPGDLGRVRMPDVENRIAEAAHPLADDDRPLYEREVDASFFGRLALPDTPHRAGALAMLRSGPLAEHFSRFLLGLFGRHGLVVVEPRDLGGEAPLRRALAEPDVVEGALARGARALEALGFKAPLRELGANVYGIAGKRVRGGEGRLSAGVAMRLILQDSVLPTAAYVGGPNEIGYSAQLRELYDAFGVAMPAIVPRISATLVEHRVARVMEKFSIAARELWGDLSGRLAGSVPAAEIDAIARDAAARIGALDAPAHEREKTARKVAQAIEAFKRRVVEDRVHADGVGRAQLEKLATHVAPGGVLQERVFASVYYLAMFGTGLVDELLESLDPLGFEHQVVFI